MSTAKFSIKLTTPESAIQGYIEQWKREMDGKIFRRLSAIGELCVNASRKDKTGKDYKDQTGNLRSSTGYVIAHNGEVMTVSDFKPVKDTAKEGPAKGRDYALSLVKEIQGDWVLIVVAGMNYARYVQAKGYDVLDSAEGVAERMIKQLFKNDSQSLI